MTVVNLNKARKARDKAKAVLAAAENRARFGRRKAERLTTDAERAAIDRTIDGARRETE